MNGSRAREFRLLDVTKTREIVAKNQEELQQLYTNMDTKREKGYTSLTLRFLAIQLGIAIVLYAAYFLLMNAELRDIAKNLANTLISAALLFVVFGIYWQKKEEAFAFVEAGSKQYERSRKAGERFLTYAELVEKQDAIEPDLAMHEKLLRYFEEWQEEAGKYSHVDWE